MKEQDETPEEQLHEVEVGRLLEEEFRVMIAKMFQDLGEKSGRYRKYLTKFNLLLYSSNKKLESTI